MTNNLSISRLVDNGRAYSTARIIYQITLTLRHLMTQAVRDTEPSIVTAQYFLLANDLATLPALPRAVSQHGATALVRWPCQQVPAVVNDD